MEQVGIEPIYLLTQLINVGILLAILTKLLYRPILKVLDERRNAVEQSMKNAQQVQSELVRAEKKADEVIQKARNEAKAIIEEGKTSAAALEKDLLARARQEANDIVGKGRRDIETERAEMEKTVRAQAVTLAVGMTETLLGEVLSVHDHKKLIETKVLQLRRQR